MKFGESADYILDWIHRMPVTFVSHRLLLTAAAAAVAVPVVAVAVAGGIVSGLVACHMGQILAVAHCSYKKKLVNILEIQSFY